MKRQKRSATRVPTTAKASRRRARTATSSRGDRKKRTMGGAGSKVGGKGGREGRGAHKTRSGCVWLIQAGGAKAVRESDEQDVGTKAWSRAEGLLKGVNLCKDHDAHTSETIIPRVAGEGRPIAEYRMLKSPITID